MSEMIERAARDWFEAQNDTPGATWETIYPEARAEIREFVRFVIAAMREPTEEMLRTDLCAPHVVVAYRAMVSAALAEGDA